MFRSIQEKVETPLRQVFFEGQAAEGQAGAAMFSEVVRIMEQGGSRLSMDAVFEN